MNGLCGADCKNCDLLKNKKCIGCINSKRCPFGKKCFIAKYIEIGGIESFNELKKVLIKEINSLNIERMPKIEELYPLHGELVNIEYPLPNGEQVKFINDKESYLGNQVECIFNEKNIKKYFGILANMSFILICEYEENGKNPELIIYKKR